MPSDQFSNVPCVFALTIEPGRPFHTFVILCMKKNASWHLFWICFSLISIYAPLSEHLCHSENSNSGWRYLCHLQFYIPQLEVPLNHVVDVKFWLMFSPVRGAQLWFQRVQQMCRPPILSQYLFWKRSRGKEGTNLDKHSLSTGNLLLRPLPWPCDAEVYTLLLVP